MSSWLDFVQKPMSNNVQYTDFQKNPERTYKQKKTRLRKEKQPVKTDTKKSKNKIIVNVNFGGEGKNPLISKFPNVPIHSGANNISINDIQDIQKQLRTQIKGLQDEINNNRFRDNTNMKTEIDTIKRQSNDIFSMLGNVNRSTDINKTLTEIAVIQGRKYKGAGRPPDEERVQLSKDTQDLRDKLQMQDPSSVPLRSLDYLNPSSGGAQV
jgi:hypothetical protein